MTIHVIDSHTGGEPTRLVVEGGPDLGNGSMAERLAIFRRDHDRFRSAVVNEPRGSNAMVGALLCEPVDRDCAAGVIFFNNVGYLGMCGHGTIGLVASLAWMKWIGPGSHRVETPVGEICADLHKTGAVTVANVQSYRHLKDVQLEVDGFGPVTGDVAWGGNWFFLTDESPVLLDLVNIEALTDYAWRIRQALAHAGITGENGAEIDHIELSIELSEGRGKNFVLCPGKEYDRSPCGTGTSAKVACLYADGKLLPGDVWRQESIVGSCFEATVRADDGGRVRKAVYPLIQGSAFVNSEARLILNAEDPFCWGIRR